MAWTTPKTFVVGEVLTAAALNVHLRDNLKALHRLAVSTGATSSGTYSNMTQTAVIDEFKADFGGTNGWSATGFKIPEAGRYEVMARAVWTSATGSGSCGLRVDRLDSGGVGIETVAENLCSVINGAVSCAGLMVANAGEFIKIPGYVSATGAAGLLTSRVTVVQRG
jgi:hypothetical protein